MNAINQLTDFLQGKKTYLVCAITILTAIVSYLNHQISLMDVVWAVLAALGAASGRHAITTTAQKVIDASQAAAAVAATAPAGGVPQSQGQPHDPNDLG